MAPRETENNAYAKFYLLRPKLLSVDLRFDSNQENSETFSQNPLFLLVTFFIFLAYYIFSLLYTGAAVINQKPSSMVAEVGENVSL